MDQTYAWMPDPARVEDRNVSRLRRRVGAADLADLRRRSTADIGWWWAEVIADLDIPFTRPWTDVVDVSDGIPWARWFTDAGFNAAHACVARWATTTPDRAAMVHRTEDATTTTITYAQMADQVAAAAAGLRRLGLGRGDAVALLMPMCPEAVVALHAIAAIGGLVVPLFSGYAPAAITTRLDDGQVRAVITADHTIRGGHDIDLTQVLGQALDASAGTVDHVVVVQRHPDRPRALPSGQTGWAQLVAEPAVLADVIADTDAQDPLLLAYTSGTTGRPKGAVLPQAGFAVKVISELAYSFDVGPDSTFCWVSDMGWILGPLSVVGVHGNGATLLLAEGLPTHPDVGGLWDLVADHGVTVLGISPTLARTLQAKAATAHTTRDLSSLDVVGSSGEPWDPTSYAWVVDDVLGGRVPIINFSGGTEVGGSFLAPSPIEPLKACSLGGPTLGMDVDVLDADGTPVRGSVGELVCRQPWPAMTMGLWQDKDRYLEAYWSTYAGLWRHGDWAMVDHDGQWFLYGRSDEVMNIAGKRLGPAEVESVLGTHPAVAEAAAVGVPDPTRGETIWCFWVPADPEGPDVSNELADRVAAEMGRPFRPSLVRRVPALPKTRSAKTLRRAVRAAALGTDPGDLSSAENPEALDGIRTAVADQAG